MSLTYSTWKTTIATMLVVDEDNTAFTTILPSMIDYSEGRIYRELDLLGTQVRDTSGTLTINSRNFTLPTPATGRYVVVSAMNLLSSGTRFAQLQPASLEFIDAAFPSTTYSAVAGEPAYFAMLTDQSVVVAPAPSAGYTVEVIGEIKPTPLSVSNTTTYLTSYLPDIFVAASMIFGSAYQRNFGAQSEDPKMASSWESQYQVLIASENIENHRAKFQSVSWTSKSPSPIAAPQRG